MHLTCPPEFEPPQSWKFRVFDLAYLVALLRSHVSRPSHGSRSRVKAERSEPARVALSRFRARVVHDLSGEESAVRLARILPVLHT
jgi:ABC-type hemin transport system ATPase subunit